MACLVELEKPTDFDTVAGFPGVPPLTLADFVRDGADTHWALLDRDERVAARCSLWWTSSLCHDGHQTGLIGHYAARDGAAARPLLEHACSALAAHGCTLAVGPMDGSTWRGYRLVTERGSEPRFFLEPDNPDDWPAHFVERGFTALARYRSALNRHLDRRDPRAEMLARRLEAAGITIRPIETSRIEEEMRRIYAVSIASFDRGLLYRPVGEEEFLEQYRPLAPRIAPDLVLMAERDGRPIGFILALPDWLQAERGEPIDTIVIKTVGVINSRSHAGLGRVLAWRCEQLASGLGYRRSIHALMREASTSGNISRGYAQTMRGYALFARSLGDFCPARL